MTLTDGSQLHSPSSISHLSAPSHTHLSHLGILPIFGTWSFYDPTRQLSCTCAAKVG